MIDLEKSLLASVVGKLENIKTYNITKDLFFTKSIIDIFSRCCVLLEKGYKIYNPSADEIKYIREDVWKYKQSDANIPSIIENIKELKAKFKTSEVLQNIITNIDKKNLKEILAELNTIQSNIKYDDNNELLTTKDFTKEFNEIFEGVYKVNSDIKTGFYYTDKKIYGLHRNCTTIFSAPTGYGKTSFALNLAKNIGKTKNVLYINLEMNKTKIIQRFICMLGELEKEQLENSSKEIKNIIRNVENEFKKLKIKFTHGKPKTIDDIILTIRNANKEKEIDLVIIDYIGRIKDRDNEQQKEHLKFKDWVMKLNEMRATDENYHLWILTQLNRNSETMMNSVDGRVNGREAMQGSYNMLSEPDLVFTWYFHKDYGWILHCDKNRDGESGWDMSFNFNKKYQNITENKLIEIVEKRTHGSL